MEIMFLSALVCLSVFMPVNNIAENASTYYSAIRVGCKWYKEQLFKLWGYSQSPCGSGNFVFKLSGLGYIVSGFSWRDIFWGHEEDQASTEVQALWVLVVYHIIHNVILVWFMRFLTGLINGTLPFRHLGSVPISSLCTFWDLHFYKWLLIYVLWMRCIYGGGVVSTLWVCTDRGCLFNQI